MSYYHCYSAHSSPRYLAHLQPVVRSYHQTGPSVHEAKHDPCNCSRWAAAGFRRCEQTVAQFPHSFCSPQKRTVREYCLYQYSLIAASAKFARLLPNWRPCSPVITDNKACGLGSPSISPVCPSALADVLSTFFKLLYRGGNPIDDSMHAHFYPSSVLVDVGR